MNIAYFIMKQGEVLGHTENFSEAGAEAKEHNATVVPFVPAMAVAQALDNMGRVLLELADNARENGCPLEAKGMEDAGEECLDEAGRISAGVGPVVSESVVQQLASMVEMVGANGTRTTPLYERPAPTPTKGEEIHVNVDGDSVYTLPLEPTGMAAPRFVVHVPAPDEREIAARALDDFRSDVAGWVRLLSDSDPEARALRKVNEWLHSRAKRLRAMAEGGENERLDQC